MPTETPLFHSILTPALALVVLSLIVWAAMVATRIPAMARAKVPPQGARYTAELTMLPAPARDIADNYNHLMEQPTLFYALVFYSYLAGQQNDPRWCPAVYALFRRVDPAGPIPEPHIWATALKYLLGFKNVRNYDGSWTEWGNSVGVPIEK